MSVVVIADLRGKRGSVAKDTVVGGYGSRFRGDSVVTRLAKNARRVFLNVPSIHAGYLASMFAAAGHKVVITHDDQPISGDLALVLTSLVDYRHERAWGIAARKRGLRVGFFGAAATHLPELFDGAGDFIIQGEPEAAGLGIAKGDRWWGLVNSPAINDLDSLSFPRWDLFKTNRFSYATHRGIGLTRAFPMLTSRSCPEHCTYCPHRITASFRARSVNSVVDEMAELCEFSPRPHIKIRDPLFTYNRDRCFRISQEILDRELELTFECETRMDDLDEQLIRMMHAAGLREISFGVESPNPMVLKRAGRRYIPHEHMKAMVNLCWDLGVMTTAFYVIGFLQETEEMIEDTIQFACDLDTTYANFKILTPYPGTPQFKQLQPLIFEKDWEQFDGYTLTFRHPHLTPRRARLMLGMAYSRFMARPSQLMNWLGLHKYSHHHWLKKADAWSWRQQDYFDRPWLSERKVAV
ncbi:MAG TPA: radical SAM protein [Pyrinomonadaceae bacterium]|nr:radical SAM protein [Pyrinomonadaceae bacterium]